MGNQQQLIITTNNIDNQQQLIIGNQLVHIYDAKLSKLFAVSHRCDAW